MLFFHYNCILVNRYESIVLNNLRLSLMEFVKKYLFLAIINGHSRCLYQNGINIINVKKMAYYQLFKAYYLKGTSPLSDQPFSVIENSPDFQFFFLIFAYKCWVFLFFCHLHT